MSPAEVKYNCHHYKEILIFIIVIMFDLLTKALTVANKSIKL